MAESGMSLTLGWMYCLVPNLIALFHSLSLPHFGSAECTNSATTGPEWIELVVLL